MAEELTTLQTIGKEARRDKYLCFALCMVLLTVWLFTRAELIGTLLTASVGAFAGLVRGGQDSEKSK